MIAMWILYSVLVSLVLLASATGIEYVVRALGLPTRIVWVVTICLSIVLSGTALIYGKEAPNQHLVPESTKVASGIPSAQPSIQNGLTPITTQARQGLRNFEPNSTDSSDSCQSFMQCWESMLGGWDSLDQVILKETTARFNSWNNTVLVGWVVCSIALLLYWLIALLRWRHIQKSLHPQTLDDVSVWMSDHIGPAVFGFLHYRIVLPAWVSALPSQERYTILAHEQEHVRARDPVWLFMSCGLLLLQPWNVGLWWMCAKLRFAIETDCDARVLENERNAVTYSRLLLTVYERSTPGLTPLVALLEPTSHLELRIRRMLNKKPVLLSMSGTLAMLVAVVFAVTAFVAPQPRVENITVNPMGSAQQLFEGTVTYQNVRFDSIGYSPQIMVYSAKGSRLRVETFRPREVLTDGMMIGLYSIDSDTVYFLAPDRKMAGAFPIDPAAAMRIDGTEPKKIGTEIIAGKSCDSYQASDSKGQEWRLCVVPGMGRFWFLGALMGQGDKYPIHAAGPFGALLSQGNFPLKMELLKEGKVMRGWIATVITQGKLEDNFFTVPNDYSRHVWPMPNRCNELPPERRSSCLP